MWAESERRKTLIEAHRARTQGNPLQECEAALRYVTAEIVYSNLEFVVPFTARDLRRHDL